jgi:hypothetical protein
VSGNVGIRQWGTSRWWPALIVAAVGTLAVFGTVLADDEPDYEDTSWWHGGRECRNTGTEEIEWPSGNWFKEYHVCVEENADYWAFHTWRDEHLDAYTAWALLIDQGVEKNGNVNAEREEGKEPKESKHSESADGEEERTDGSATAHSFWSPAPTLTEEYYSSGSLSWGDSHYSGLAGYTDDRYWR